VPLGQSGWVPVVVECPKGSRWRWRLTPEGQPVRIRLLPDRLRYPFNYGFVPGTLAEDGDALDAIVLGGRRVPLAGRLRGRLVGGLRFRDRRGEDPKLLLVPWRPGTPAPLPDLTVWEGRVRRFFAGYKPPDQAPWIGPVVPAEEALAWLTAAWQAP
jgi:inorganic pyrophosphatase